MFIRTLFERVSDRLVVSQVGALLIHPIHEVAAPQRMSELIRFRLWQAKESSDGILCRFGREPQEHAYLCFGRGASRGLARRFGHADCDDRRASCTVEQADCACWA